LFLWLRAFNCVNIAGLLRSGGDTVFSLALDAGTMWLIGVPAVGVAPEWMSEKAIAIGCYFVASGIDVILGNPFYVSGSKNVYDYLHNGVKDDFGASFHLIEDPYEAADRIVEMLNKKRDALGINKKAERKLFDMKDRRAL